MFEDQLIESKKPKRAKKRWLSLPVAILVHVVVVGLAVGAAFWAIGDIPEPPIPVTFYTTPPPPPPPPPPPAPKPERPHVAKVVPEPHHVTAPVAIPETVPKPRPAPPPAAGSNNGVEGGVEGGVPGGVVGGVLGGTPIPTPAPVKVPPPEPQGPVPVSRLQHEPARMTYVPPVYPVMARTVGIQGQVVLDIIIGKDGAVREVHVVHGLPFGITEAAVDAIKQWRYEPSFLNGKPVEVKVEVTLDFRLR